MLNKRNRHKALRKAVNRLFRQNKDLEWGIWLVLLLMFMACDYKVGKEIMVDYEKDIGK